jgi:hypothetical protein
LEQSNDTRFKTSKPQGSPQKQITTTTTTFTAIKMSALTSRTAAVTRRLATTTTSSTLTRAAFTTTARHQKSAVDSAKDTLKSVNRKVADKLVDGIDVGSQ